MPDETTIQAALLSRPFPARRAAEVLRDRIILHLQRERPDPGSAFLTDASLVRSTGLSRSTVRRALEDLQGDGWISREVGRGTFVGPRSSMAAAGGVKPAEEADAGAPASPPIVRVAVMIFQIEDLATDWYTPSVLDGIDAAADRADLRIELLGVREGGVEQMSRRLEQSRPDVLVCLANAPRHALVLRDAERLGIPVVAAGTAFMDVWPVSVIEDNTQGMNLAVDRLLDAGHRRIGLVMVGGGGRWIEQRANAFEDRCESAGLPLADATRCRLRTADLNVNPGAPEREAARIGRFLDGSGPTAVVCGDYIAAMLLGRVLAARGLRVPRDLSVVTFDQHPRVAEWLGVEADTVHLPLRAMGLHLATLSRSAAEGAKLPENLRVPCRLVPGASVVPPPPAASGSANT